MSDSYSISPQWERIPVAISAVLLSFAYLSIKNIEEIVNLEKMKNFERDWMSVYLYK